MHRSGKIIGITIVILLILGFGIDLYAPSFPAMESFFGTSRQLVQLTISTYFLGYVIGLIFLGPISDAFGRKRPLIIGLCFYVVLSLLCSFSKSIEMLLVLRCLQGVGVAIVGVSFRSILGDVFSGRDLAKAMNYMSMSYRMGITMAPVIGGYLQVFFGWSSNFYFLAGYGLFAVLIVALFLSETHLERISFHPRSMGKRYLVILRNRVFVGGALCVGITYTMSIVFNVIGPFFIQDVLGYSPITFGQIAFGMGVFVFGGILLNRLLINRYSHLKMIKIGIYLVCGIAILGTVCALIFPVNLYSFLIPISLIFFFIGLINSNINGYILDCVPKGKGVASALLGIILISCTTVLSALSSFLKSDTIRPTAFAYLGMALLCFLFYHFLFKAKSPDQSGL